ncbi:MAG TPA: MBL fold metallo-hydrolase [Clostridiales bacterium]|jgi:7,8-dihydropterin-6-yl-methyl-4-(beta-D-ribofuranosyl)aminobenzene 5'-phosphate synthase|nr:MBL fold metallo-hydrolase [Clostridiales bacterium]
MRISVLVENTSHRPELGCEHGLSLYVETNKHRLLFDTGASNLFLLNAEQMGVDLTKIDTLIISHGHYDHGGGLQSFLQVNTKALVYLQEEAFETHCALRADGRIEDIGIDATLKHHPRVILNPGSMKIDDQLSLFTVNDCLLSDSCSQTARSIDAGTRDPNLFQMSDGELKPDSFAHEQNLIIHEKNSLIALTGCAHNGVAIILDSLKQITGRLPDHFIGGFHLSRNPQDAEHNHRVDRLANYLRGTDTRFYTCHCTGIEAFKRLHAIMGEQVVYLSTGDVLLIGENPAII